MVKRIGNVEMVSAEEERVTDSTVFQHHVDRLKNATGADVGPALAEIADMLILAGRAEEALPFAIAAYEGPLAVDKSSSVRPWVDGGLPIILCWILDRPFPPRKSWSVRDREDLRAQVAIDGRRHLSYLVAIKSRFDQAPGQNWDEQFFETLANVESKDDALGLPRIVIQFVNDLARVLEERMISAFDITPKEFTQRDRIAAAAFAAECATDELANTFANLSERIGFGGDYRSQECWHMLTMLRLANGDYDRATSELIRKIRASENALRSHLFVHPEYLLLLCKGGLADCLGVTSEAVADAQAYLKNIEMTGAPKRARPISDWSSMISDFEEKALASSHFQDYVEDDPDRYGPAMESGCLSNPGAAKAEIEALEKRLGKQLPPSYRSFLAVTNGLVLPFEGFDLWPVEKVDWFINTEREWAEVWHQDFAVPDDLYFQYGDNQDCIHFRAEYLKTALQISSTQDGYVLLLNPEVVDEDGEWEAWLFGNKLPGAYRYRLFTDLMVDQVLRAPEL